MQYINIITLKITKYINKINNLKIINQKNSINLIKSKIMKRLGCQDDKSNQIKLVLTNSAD